MFMEYHYKIQSKMETPKITYSKDYDLLFDLVMDGNIIPAFVDYLFLGEHLCRDVCWVKALKYDNKIYFGVRGKSYCKV